MASRLVIGLPTTSVIRRFYSTTTAATTILGTFDNAFYRRKEQRTRRVIPTSALCGTTRNSSSSSASATTGSTENEAYGTGMDQNAMMESDMLIPVDHNDTILVQGDIDVSKKQAHVFSSDQPRGILHRAFSFFMFDSEHRMLLTKRASSKITFPGVWTNTVCSHPLRNMVPDEVDDPSVEGLYPNFPGIKHAAIRKCYHELGIPAQYIPHEQIQFITRFHYWAADTMTYGNDATCPWGEHEVDYVLFFKAATDDDTPIVPDPEEVEDYKYVTPSELRQMMDDPELSWSPWFRGIVDRGFWKWWDDLDNSLKGTHTNTDVVFFDPPKQYYAAYNHEPTHNHKETGILRSTTGTTEKTP